MFCENCGKSLIRGYQFCLECGTPVPPENTEEEQAAAMPETNDGMPALEPLSEDGTLVFCPNCGMHMQKTTATCDKCGMVLQAQTPDNAYNNLPKNGSVPLWNTERVDYGYEGLTDEDINQLNNFVNGGGISVPDDYDDSADGLNQFGGGIEPIGGAGIGAVGADVDYGDEESRIEALTSQFANLAKSSDEMPSIGGKNEIIHDEILKVENFSMESSYVDSDYVDTSSLPVIEGASMDFDPDEPEPEDPNAFVMTDDNIKDITPTYDDIPAFGGTAEKTSYFTEPEAAPTEEYSAPTFEEDAPAAEEAIPAYEDEAAAIPVFSAEDEVAAIEAASESYDIPTYEEAPAEEYSVPTFEEEAPATEEAVPAYEDEVAAIPVFSAEDEVAAIEAAAEEEYSIPVYEDEETENDSYSAAYTSDDTESYGADIPVYEEPEEIKEEKDDSLAAGAAVGLAAATVASALDEEQPASYNSYNSEPTMPEMPEIAENNNTAAEMSYAEEPAPAYESSYISPYSRSTEPVAATAAAVEEEPEVDLGRLIYCRNCGQDMYEKELVCKNCGAPKREEYKKKNVAAKKEPFKLFGIINIPTLIGVGVAVIALAALILTSVNGGKQNITGNEQLNANKTTVSTTASSAEPVEDDSKPVDDGAVTADAPEESSAIPAETSEPAQAETKEVPPAETADAPVESVDTPADDTEEVPAQSSVTTSKQEVTSTPKNTTTTKSTTTQKSTTTTKSTTTKRPNNTASATVLSQNKERDKIVAAYETISAELGKVDQLARATGAAVMFDSRNEDVAAKSFYTGDFAKAMIKNIKSGKSSVASAVSSAKPTTAELKGAYNALVKLQDKYLAYYNYVTAPASFSSYTSKCDSYLSDFNSYAKSNLKAAALNTSAQTTNDEIDYYGNILSEAVTAVENACSAYSTLSAKLSALNSSQFEGKFTETLSNNISTYLKAAQYTQAARSYCNMLASAPGKYSSALSNLKTACSKLESAGETLDLAQFDNTPSSFKSTIGSDITSAQNAAKAVKSAL